MATPVRATLTTRDELSLPQLPTPEPSGWLGWMRDFVGALRQTFRIHKHLFPASIAGEMAVNTYTVASQPTAAQAGPAAIVFVSDAGAGAKFQGSTGSAWVNLG